MPRKKKLAEVAPISGVTKAWVLYSTNRQYCFQGEIDRGFFSRSYRCGCVHCDPDLALPEPPFTPPHPGVYAGQPKC